MSGQVGSGLFVVSLVLISEFDSLKPLICLFLAISFVSMNLVLGDFL